MWYKDPEKGLYWLVLSGNLLPHVMPPGTPLIRKLKKPFSLLQGDLNAGGITYSIYQEATTPPKFPDKPTFQNLSALMVETLNLVFGNVTLYKDGGLVIAASPGTGGHFLYWHHNTNTVTIVRPELTQISLYKEYMGSDFQFSDGKIRTKNTDWLEMIDGLKFNLNTLVLTNPELYEKVMNKTRLVRDTINEYLNWLTAGTMLDLHGSIPARLTPSHNCVGCANFNASHLIVHLHRKELPFFIVMQVCDLFPHGFSAWDMVYSLKQGNEKHFNLFKVNLRTFFEDILINHKSMYKWRSLGLTRNVEGKELTFQVGGVVPAPAQPPTIGTYNYHPPVMQENPHENPLFEEVDIDQTYVSATSVE